MTSLALRYHIAIIFCIATIISTGCASTYQKVNAELLEQNKNKTFKLGVIKAVGNPMAGVFGSSGIEYKKKALDNIPIAEICSILSSKYSITIDAHVDKTPKIVKEELGSSGPPSGGTRPGLSFTYTLRPSIDNAYYGNLQYESASTLGILVGVSNSHITNNNEFPDVVNVTYSLDYGLKENFYYDIDISSSEQKIIEMHGIVGSVEAKTEDQEACWNSYVDYAARISEAIKKDLLEPSKK